MRIAATSVGCCSGAHEGVLRLAGSRCREGLLPPGRAWVFRWRKRDLLGVSGVGGCRVAGDGEVVCEGAPGVGDFRVEFEGVAERYDGVVAFALRRVRSPVRSERGPVGLLTGECCESVQAAGVELARGGAGRWLAAARRPGGPEILEDLGWPVLLLPAGFEAQACRVG